jgi:15-cis-phytoene synthase
MQLPVALVRAPQDGSAFGSVIRTKARSFSFAARFLDPERRRATEVLYAFFRTVDDLVDERAPASDLDPIYAELDRWDRWLSAPDSDARQGPLECALADTIERYAIPRGYLRALIKGQRDDLDGREIQTFDDLERYSFRVAASVGLAMCHVLGATGRRALMAATALGIAMQLTNVLRDVRDDLERGRVYLPADELARFACPRDRLEACELDAPLRALLRFQTERARRYYLAGVDGLAELSPETRFPIALAARLYGRILDKIEGRRFDVFSRRAAVGHAEKVALACRLAVAMRLGRLESTGVDAESCLGEPALAELAASGAPGFRAPTSERLPRR